MSQDSRNKYLIIQLRQLGDILLTTPMAAAIRQYDKNAHIAFLCHRMGRLVLDANPYIDQVYYFNDPESITQELRTLRDIRREKFDVVFDFMNNPRSAFYSAFSGAKETVAFLSRRKFAYSKTVPKPSEPLYIVNEKAQLLASCGVAWNLSLPVLVWGEHNCKPLELLLATDGYDDGGLRIALSPTHRREPRKWPLEHYVQLAERLSKDWGAKVLWLWGPGEEEIIDVAIKNCACPTFKMPKTSMQEMAAILANQDLFIGNSNGPSHVAVAANCPSLQLHGHTSGRSWCPDDERHWYIQAPDYMKVDFPDMSQITVDQVMEFLQNKKDQLYTWRDLAKKTRPVKNWPRN